MPVMPSLFWIAVGLGLTIAGAALGRPAACGGGIGILLIEAIRQCTKDGDDDGL